MFKCLEMLLWAVVVSVGLYGCSGGGGSSVDTTTPEESNTLKWDEGNWDGKEWG